MKKFFQLFLLYPQFLAFLAAYPMRDKISQVEMDHLDSNKKERRDSTCMNLPKV